MEMACVLLQAGIEFLGELISFGRVYYARLKQAVRFILGGKLINTT
jgi:hypothetical protein